jgi:cytochrome c biogenesis protein CcmG/thiol:disulfide interchange protein DsbE
MTESSAPSSATSRRWPYLIPLIVILALGGVFGKRLLDIQQGKNPSLIPTVLLDTPVPEINLPPLPGRGEALTTDDLKGQVTLVNIWGSWCIACLSEHPLLLAISQEGAIPVHGIAWRDKPEDSLAWLARHGDPYSKVGQDPRSEAAIAFGVTAAPETFIVDANGVIRFKKTGPVTPADWQDTMKPLIEELNK